MLTVDTGSLDDLERAWRVMQTHGLVDFHTASVELISGTPPTVRVHGELSGREVRCLAELVGDLTHFSRRTVQRWRRDD